MSDYTRTPNYNLYKPITGRDDDVWGDQICTNMDTIDTIMFANQGGTTAPTASPAYGRNGTNWLPVLPLVGGTMTGPLALAANASQPLQAVTLQQMTAATGAYLPLIGGVLTGKLGMNLTLPADSDPSAIYTTYQSMADGGSLFWNAYWKAGAGPRVLATGASAWATVSGASGYWAMSVAPSAAAGATPVFKQSLVATAKGNVIVGDWVEPQFLSTATTTDGGVLKAWYTIANNYMSFMYYDGTNYRRLNGTLAPTQIISAGGSYMFQGAAVGSANSTIPTLNTLLTLNAAGNLLGAGGIVFPPADNTASSWHAAGFQVNLGGIFGANIYNGPGGWQYIQPGFGYYLWNDTSTGAVNLTSFASGAAGAVVATGWTWLFSRDGSFTSPGSIWATNRPGVFGLQDFTGGYYGLRFSTDGWRLQFNNANGFLQYISYAGASLFQIDNAGSITAAGNITCNGELRAVNNIMNVTGTFYVANNYAYYLSRNGSNGNWYFVENGTTNFTVQTDGTCLARSGFQSGWLRSTGGGQVDGTFSCSTAVAWGNTYSIGLYCGGSGDGSFGMFRGSGNNYQQFLGNWYWAFTVSNGFLAWTGSGNQHFIIRNPNVASDWLVYNAIGPTGGNGAYLNVSDRRMKEDIVPAKPGLAEILQLKPVEFMRVAPPAATSPIDGKVNHARRQREIGFIAQDVREVLPLAVHILGQEMPDGTGGIDDANPSLALTSEVITAALVNAVKTLEARLAALEGAR